MIAFLQSSSGTGNGNWFNFKKVYLKERARQFHMNLRNFNVSGGSLFLSSLSDELRIGCSSVMNIFNMQLQVKSSLFAFQYLVVMKWFGLQINFKPG